jgi:glycosyltransferase involved in cell wall biosynthesis
MIRVLFIIRTVGAGGAERQLAELVRAMRKTDFDVHVAVFYPGGALSGDFAAIPGVHCHSLDKRGRWDVLGFLWRTFRLVRRLRPQIVYSFASEPNLIALFIGRLARAKVAWGIRRSTPDPSALDRLSKLTFRMGAWLSAWPDRVIYNSERGRRTHAQHGYSTANAIVVSNGFDTRRFHPDVAARERQRLGWGVGPQEQLVGIVGRLDPLKNHRVFLEAAARLASLRPNIRFVCVGRAIGTHR